jgi:MFS transporter, ACS family, hexuronate transporter
MLIYAGAVLPVVFAGRMQGVWSVVALLSLATAAHQAWSANMFTLASDMFPRRAVASVVVGTSGAALLMAFISTLVGYVLKWTNGNYAPAVRRVWHRLPYGSFAHSPARAEFE